MNENQQQPPPALPIPKDCYLGFNYAIDRQSAANLVALAQQATTIQAKSVTICISSNGGAPDQALYAYEILTALPIPIYTHAIGTVQSAAMIVFMAGEKRTAAPGTSFLFHDTVYNVGGPSPFRYEDLIGTAKGIEHNDRWSHELIAGILNRPPAEIAEWFQGQEPRNTQFALDNGIIERVESLKIPPSAEFAQIAYKF